MLEAFFRCLVVAGGERDRKAADFVRECSADVLQARVQAGSRDALAGMGTGRSNTIAAACSRPGGLTAPLSLLVRLASPYTLLQFVI